MSETDGERGQRDERLRSLPLPEEDDVDLFVSPRRFVGATPSAKIARDKVFKTSATTLPLEASPQTSRGEKPSQMEKVEYRIPITVPDELKGPNISATMEEERLARQKISRLHAVVFALGFVLAVCGFWAASRQRDKKLVAYLAFGSLVLGEPIYYGITMVVIGFVMMVIGFLGGYSLTESMAAGFVRNGDGWKILLYQIMMIVAATSLVLVLTETTHTFVDLNGRPKFPHRGTFYFFLVLPTLLSVTSIIVLVLAAIAGTSATWHGMIQLNHRREAMHGSF